MNAVAHTRRKRDHEQVEPIKDDMPNISIWPVMVVVGCIAFIFGWALNAVIVG